jgi:hypothetical protein
VLLLLVLLLLVLGRAGRPDWCGWRTVTDTAKKFLDENQAMGYIEPINSPYSLPFFFIKKKDGSLHPVQDYCKINKWTIQDVYPIPQITHILEQLQGKMLFTALDI